MQSQRWLPLEANPDVMNQFLKQLGVGSNWQFVDVYGMDAELLNLVPRPVCAVLLLFPITEKYEAFKAEEETRIKKYGQILSPEVYFMTQTISNACGTIGLIHGLANNQKKLTFDSRSTIKKFLEVSKSLSPAERGRLLEHDESIRVTHETSAQEGQSEAPGIDDKVDLHFITFIEKGGVLYELDGRKAFPINHGSTTNNTLLENAILVCQTFMKRDPEELRFTVVALAKA